MLFNGQTGTNLHIFKDMFLFQAMYNIKTEKQGTYNMKTEKTNNQFT